MSTVNARQQAFRRVLAREAGTSADATAIASAAGRLYERAFQQLTPLIGAAGIAAIYTRAVHIAQREFPWLAPVEGTHGGDGLVSNLETRLARQEASTAAAAAVAVLIALADLLSSLIGDGLTTGVLREAWPGEFSYDPQQERTT